MAAVRSGRWWYMKGLMAEPVEQPTRMAVSPGSASSTASQHAAAMSSMLSPSAPLGERPYPGISMPMHRYQVDRCAIWKIQHDWSMGLGWMKAMTGPVRPMRS